MAGPGPCWGPWEARARRPAAGADLTFSSCREALTGQPGKEVKNLGTKGERLCGVGVEGGRSPQPPAPASQNKDGVPAAQM